MLEDALRFTFEKLTKEELVDVAILLTVEGLHSAGRKPSVKPVYNTYKRNLQSNHHFIFKTKEKAEAVLLALKEHFDETSQISVADVHEVCGKESNYLLTTIGWNSFDGIGIQYRPYLKERWQLILPRPTRL